MQFNSSTQMKMLQKKFDCQSFENSQENVSDGVYFSKAANLVIVYRLHIYYKQTS